MKYILFLNIIMGAWAFFNKIASSNKIKQQAEKAYQAKEYQTASKLYQSLITSYNLHDDKIRLNLAHSLFLDEERRNASEHYQLLTHSKDNNIRSLAFQQLGVINALKGQYEIALSNFKQALEISPSNEAARYNYELVQKLNDHGSEEHSTSITNSGGKSSSISKGITGKNGNRTIKLQPGNNQYTSQKEMQNPSRGRNTNESSSQKESKHSSTGDSHSESLRSKNQHEIQIPEDKVKMILEIMKNEELQYLQETQRNIPNESYTNRPSW